MTYPISLAIIIPTVGRVTLRDTLKSIQPQLQNGDSVYVIPDGIPAFHVADGIVESFRCRQFKCLKPNWAAPFRDWGHSPSNFAIREISDHDLWSHLARIDDDDSYTINALTSFRYHAKQHYRSPLIFQMELPDGNVIWKDNEMGIGHYGTPCFLIPRFLVMPRFGKEYWGDHSYIQDATELFGEPVWVPEIVCNVRPHERG